MFQTKKGGNRNVKNNFGYVFITNTLIDINKPTGQLTLRAKFDICVQNNVFFI